MSSSAKLQAIDFQLVSKSFKKMLKRRGPSMGPCGTPVIACSHEQKFEASFFLRFQFERELLISFSSNIIINTIKM